MHLFLCSNNGVILLMGGNAEKYNKLKFECIYVCDASGEIILYFYSYTAQSVFKTWLFLHSLEKHFTGKNDT